MYLPYLNYIIKTLSVPDTQTAVSGILKFKFWGSTASPAEICLFLKSFRTQIQEYGDLYKLMIKRLILDSNTFYYHKFTSEYLFGTLLDLFLYEMDVYPLNNDTRPFTFKVITDLITKGARFGKQKVPADQGGIIDYIENNIEEAKEKMNLLNIKFDDADQEVLKSVFQTKISNMIAHSETPKEEFKKLQSYFPLSMNTKEFTPNTNMFSLLKRFNFKVSPDEDFPVDDTMVIDDWLSTESVDAYFKKHFILNPLTGGFKSTSRFSRRRRKKNRKLTRKSIKK